MGELIRMNRAIQYQKQISSFTGKLIRNHFGKGSESVYVTFGHTYIVIYLRNFISPAEQMLLENGQVDVVHKMREKLMVPIKSELCAYVESITGVRPDEMYGDWCVSAKTAALIAVCHRPIPQVPEIKPDYMGKEQIERELLNISRRTQKEPEWVHTCEINPRKFLIVRRGVLTQVERELIRIGQGELLRRIKNKLEKRELFANKSLEALLARTVVDVFVDWDFQSDQCVVLLILRA